MTAATIWRIAPMRAMLNGVPCDRFARRIGVIASDTPLPEGHRRLRRFVVIALLFGLTAWMPLIWVQRQTRSCLCTRCGSVSEVTRVPLRGALILVDSRISPGPYTEFLDDSLPDSCPHEWGPERERSTFTPNGFGYGCKHLSKLTSFDAQIRAAREVDVRGARELARYLLAREIVDIERFPDFEDTTRFASADKFRVWFDALRAGVVSRPWPTHVRDERLVVEEELRCTCSYAGR